MWVIVPHVLDYTVCVAETNPALYIVTAIYIPTNTHRHPQLLRMNLWMGGFKSWQHLTILGLELPNVWTGMCVRHQIETVLTYVFISSAVFLFINLLSFTPLWIVLLQLSMHGTVVFTNSVTVNRIRERKIAGKLEEISGLSSITMNNWAKQKYIIYNIYYNISI